MDGVQSTVYVVDDDPIVCRIVTRLCENAGLQVKAFGNAREMLIARPPPSPACLVLDISMPGLDGFELQAELLRRHIETPVVFITGHADIPMAVRAMKEGAADFLRKPIKAQELLKAIGKALSKDHVLAEARKEQESIILRLESLTCREQEVLRLVMNGCLNKQIAAELGATEATIKVHRRRIKDKMGFESVAELVQAVMKTGFVGNSK